MTSKYTKHPFFQGLVPLEKQCEQEDCLKKGEFKAPQSRNHLRKYRWFCLEHVRLYNESWNYYHGMNLYEVEKEKRRDETWWRPTWPFTQTVHDVKTSFMKEKDENQERLYQQKMKFDCQTKEGKALRVMNIEFPFTQKELKERYLNLAKKYHPDINQGSKEVEERLKEINLAYEILKNHIFLKS